jgi:outer membrane protein OmpA-like peptidoglycan-associated protein
MRIKFLVGMAFIAASSVVAGANSTPNLSEGRYLDHDQTVALGGVGNIVDASSNPPSKPNQEAGSYAGQKADQKTDTVSDAEMEDFNQRTLVHFDQGNARLDTHVENTPVENAHVETKLKKVADELKKDPNLQVVVEGHADAVGTPAANRQISEARANSVKSALISQGVAPAQIETYGFGATEPVASNSTVVGRAKNRRAELYLEDMEAAT